MAKESEFIKKQNAIWLKELERKRRPHFVEIEKNSFEAFLDEIEIGECYPENEQLARQIIEKLQRKYNLLNL